MTAEPDESQQKQRWLTMQMVRLLGIGCLLLGLAVMAGKLDWPVVVGYLLVINGVVDMFVIPMVLARKWKSPPP